ncbi:hypothetical protein UlMin_036597 [Ulmus minor]
MAESSDAPPAIDIAAQIAVLTAQAQENSNRLMALEEENTTLRREKRTLQECLSAVEVTPQQPRDPRFRLLKRSHLLDLLTDKGKKTVTKHDNHVEEPKEPTPERVINVITGGSEISGISYSAARRHARVFVNRETCSSQPPVGDYTDQVISFVDNEATTLINLHHDALVISLLVANCKIKRILVDNGSSTNVLFLNALQEMKIDESNIRRCTTVLVGFNGEQKFTIGDIALPVYAGGINLNVNFTVLDSPSAYNMILGRPWIHKMRAVPSTFHQVIRFPTKWGIKEIRGEQSISRECYRNTLRAKPATL